MKKSEQKSNHVVFRAEAATADLLAAVSRVAGVVEKRNSAPILGFVEIATGFGTIAVRGTDLDIEARAEIEGKGEGSLALPGHRLRDLLRAVSHVERVELISDENGIVTLAAGEVTATLVSMPAADLPNLAVGDVVWSTALGEGSLRFVLGGVRHAISTEETRYYLNGAFLSIKDGRLMAVATDGHRLAKRDCAMPASQEDQAGGIMPTKAVALSVAAVGGGEAKLTAYAGSLKKGDGPAYFEVVTGDLRLRCKAIDGTFPDWQRVVPEEAVAVATISTSTLRRALRAAKASTSERGRAVKIGPSEAGIILSVHSPDDGDMTARLECDVGGKLVEFGVNHQYLDTIAECMERIGSKTVRMHLKGSGDPIRIMPDEAIAGTLNIVMPMRV